MSDVDGSQESLAMYAGPADGFVDPIAALDVATDPTWLRILAAAGGHEGDPGELWSRGYVRLRLSSPRLVKEHKASLAGATCNTRAGTVEWDGSEPTTVYAFARRMVETENLQSLALYVITDRAELTVVVSFLPLEGNVRMPVFRVDLTYQRGCRDSLYAAEQLGDLLELFVRSIKVADAIQADLALSEQGAHRSPLELLFGIETPPNERASTSVRGYGWCTFLPAELAERLGGIDRVLHVAPVRRAFQVATPSGDGVVLVHTDRPDRADDIARQSLRTFLLPVLVSPIGPSEIIRAPERFQLCADDWARAIPGPTWR